MTDTSFAIIDNDGTIFPETPAMKQNFRDCVVKAALEMDLPMTAQEAHAIALDSQKRFNMSAARFYNEFGINRIAHFRRYNELLNINLVPRDHAPRLRAAFQNAAADPLKRAILSWATREWVERTLHHIGIRDLFRDDRIITAEKFDYLTKSESDRPIETALAALGALPSQTTIYEDSKGALKRAHGLGLAGRVYIHNGEPFEALPEQYTRQHLDLAEALSYSVR